MVKFDKMTAGQEKENVSPAGQSPRSRRQTVDGQS
jgi:hypothetical protein